MVHGSKPPLKHPNSIQQNNLPVFEDNVDFCDSNSFVRYQKRSERTAGHEYTKQVNAINLIVNKMTQQSAGPVSSTILVEKKWSKVEKGLDAFNNQMKSITNNQIMAQAPSPL